MISKLMSSKSFISSITYRKKCLDDILVDEMGKQGLQRVLEKFSFESFSQSLNEVIHSICYLDDHKSN